MALIIPFFIPHLGCPHDCLFCNQQRIAGVVKGEATTRELTETIELWLSRKKDRKRVELAFFGGSFTCMDSGLQESLLGAVQPYIKGGQVDSIRCSTRPDCIDPVICARLLEYRVETVEIGVQSLSDDVLHQARRGHSAECCRKSTSLLQSLGFQVGIQLMPGLPGDSPRLFAQTVRQVIELQPTFVRIYPALVVKDSGLEVLYNQGGFRPLTMNRAIGITAAAYQKLTAAGIEVVRMGLQPSESLSESVVAGPYHPSFGELVRSRLWFKEIRRELSKLPSWSNLRIEISHRDMSGVVGMNGKNRKRLEALGYTGRYTIVADKTMDRGRANYVVC